MTDGEWALVNLAVAFVSIVAIAVTYWLANRRGK